VADVVAGTSVRRRTAPVGEALAAWLLCAPATLAFAAFVLVPTLAVGVLSLTDYELGLPTLRFVGLDNFAELLSDRGFATSVRNTAMFVAFVTPASIGVGLALALLIEANVRGRAFFRAAFFLPVVSLIVAMATAWPVAMPSGVTSFTCWNGDAAAGLGNAEWPLVAGTARAAPLAASTASK
jgi:multiple sugar transport system permease protein